MKRHRNAWRANVADEPANVACTHGRELAPRLHLAAHMSSVWLHGLFGGALIGAASALLLLTHGRIAGISGIAGGLLQRGTTDRIWRLCFVIGLAIVGVGASVFAPATVGVSPRSAITLAIAGLLVGFGTRLGSGCTSGHGVCGLSRLSVRSIVAVGTFMVTGAVTASLAGLVS